MQTNILSMMTVDETCCHSPQACFRSTYPFCIVEFILYFDSRNIAAIRINQCYHPHTHDNSGYAQRCNDEDKGWHILFIKDIRLKLQKTYTWIISGHSLSTKEITITRKINSNAVGVDKGSPAIQECFHEFSLVYWYNNVDCNVVSNKRPFKVYPGSNGA